MKNINFVITYKDKSKRKIRVDPSRLPKTIYHDLRFKKVAESRNDFYQNTAINLVTIILAAMIRQDSICISVMTICSVMQIYMTIKQAKNLLILKKGSRMQLAYALRVIILGIVERYNRPVAIEDIYQEFEGKIKDRNYKWFYRDINSLKELGFLTEVRTHDMLAITGEAKRFLTEIRLLGIPKL